MIESILKLSEFRLANEKCEQCVFKIVPLEKSPCRECKFGKYAGTENNFVKEGESIWKA